MSAFAVTAHESCAQQRPGAPRGARACAARAAVTGRAPSRPAGPVHILLRRIENPRTARACAASALFFYSSNVNLIPHWSCSQTLNLI